MSEQKIQYEKTLEKGIRILRENPNQTTEILKIATRLSYLRGRLFEQNQKQNVPEGVSNSDTLGTYTQTAPSDKPHDDSGSETSSAREDNGDGTFHGVLKSKRGWGRSYGYSPLTKPRFPEHMEHRCKDKDCKFCKEFSSSK